MVRGVRNVEDRTPSGLLEIDNDDDNALRLMVIVPWELPGTWEEWRELFPRGPVRIFIFIHDSFPENDAADCCSNCAVYHV